MKVSRPVEAVSRESMPYSLPVAFPEDSSLRVRVWDADGQLRYEGSEPRIPRLPAGQYFVGVQSLAGDTVKDWTFRTIEVSGAVDITAIELDSTFKNPGEKITARVILSGPPAEGSTLLFEVVDNYGRSVFVTRRDAVREAVFEGQFAQSRHLYNYANVKLVSPEGTVIAEDRRAFYIAHPGPAHDDLMWMVWEASYGFNPRNRILLKQYARLGMTGALTSGDGIEASAMVNAHAVSYAYRMTGVSADNGKASPCFASPGYRASAIARIKETVEREKRFSPLFYYLGDDVKFTTYGTDVGWSQDYRAILAEWARKKYGTIKAVNEAWGTSFADFKDVEPVKKNDALTAAAGGDYELLCHWIDHQICTDAMVADWWGEMGRAIREVAPGTPSNMGSCVVGWAWPGSGIDFWQLAEGKNLVFQYPNPWIHDIFRRAARKDAMHGTWYGGYGLYNYYPYYDADYLPWWGVFRGINLHGQYYGGQSSPYYSARLLGADLGPMPVSAKIHNNFRELRGGIAKLLFNADRKNDGVAVIYSPVNVHASVVFEEGLPLAPEWQDQYTDSKQFIYMQCWEGLSYLMRDIGFSYDVVHARDVESGKFLEEGFRVLVLPLHLRVTEGEAETIRKFVEAGGLVIADVFTGVLDDSCHAGHNGVLADVLGVKFAGGIPGPKVAMGSAVTHDGISLGRLAVDGGVTLDGAEAGGTGADDTPIILVHKFGEGRVILLNTLSRDYQISRSGATEMPFRDTVAALLADAGIIPAIRCEVAGRSEEEPHLIQATEFNRYDLGDAEYVGVLRHHKLRADDAVYMADLRPKPCWIEFDREAHVYDVRRRMYRGLTDRIEDVIYPARAELFALLPYEVRDLRLEPEHQDGALVVRGQIFSHSPEVEPTTHVLHIEITEPNGRTASDLARNVVAENGQLAERIFIGYNATAGTWLVNVRDVASGIERNVPVAVR